MWAESYIAHVLHFPQLIDDGDLLVKLSFIQNEWWMLNGVKLDASDHAKYVGIIFDEHLTFHRHATLLNNAKLKRANNLIAISRHYLSKKLMHIYSILFLSNIWLSTLGPKWKCHRTYHCSTKGSNAIRLMLFALPSHF